MNTPVHQVYESYRPGAFDQTKKPSVKTHNVYIEFYKLSYENHLQTGDTWISSQSYKDCNTLKLIK